MLYCRLVGKVTQGAGNRPYIKVSTDEATGERTEDWQMRSISVSGQVIVGSKADESGANLVENYDYCEVSEMSVLAITNMDVSPTDMTLLFNKLASVNEGDTVEGVGSFVLRTIRGRKSWTLNLDDIVVTSRAAPRSAARTVAAAKK